VLDLTQDAARRQLAALIGRADILVQNLKPGAMARLGLAIENLRERHRALICCSISGYGDAGPLADRKAYDLLVQAESGLASITGGPEAPARVGISVVDIATGATAYSAILEALIARGRSGEGADIRVSMFDVMADWLTVPLLNAAAGNPPQRAGLRHPSIAPYGVFTAADGAEILISIQSERDWRKFCTTSQNLREWRKFCDVVLQMPGMAAEPRFAGNVARVRNRTETDGAVAAIFGALPSDALLARLAAADIAFAQVNDMAALSRHPHLRRIAADSAAGEIFLPAPGNMLHGQAQVYGKIPALGEHTDAVLAEIEE
jgi:formyl-CoA transferase